MKLLLSTLGVATTLVGVAAAAIGASATTTAAAWTITSTNATQPEEILGPHQTFVKTWTISGAEPLDAIDFAAAGPVFVDYDDATLPTDGETAPSTETTAPVRTEAPAPTTTTAEDPDTEVPALTTTTTEAPTLLAGSGSGSTAGFPTEEIISMNTVSDTESVLATVTFSGNCTALLDEIEVVERRGVVHVHFKNQDFKGYGYVLTQVAFANKNTLRRVLVSGSSSVYISENVLVSSNTSVDVAISISGDGSVIVAAPTTEFSLKSLSAKISSSGTIQVNAASLTLGDSLSTKISGDGGIAIVAQTSVEVNNTIASKISGDGHIFVQSPNVATFKLESKISGDGEITVSSNGSCVTQRVAISGEGTIATGSITCVDTKVRMSGEGDVVVQTTGKLLVPHEINGKVQYVGAAPQQITDGRKPRSVPSTPTKPKHHHSYYDWIWWSNGDNEDDGDDESDESDRIFPQSVTPASENVYETYTLREIPPREPTFLVLEMRQNWWGSEPHERIVISIFGVDIGASALAANTQALAVRLQTQHPILRGFLFTGFAAVVLSAVGITLHKAAVRRRRREYQPLLQVVTN